MWKIIAIVLFFSSSVMAGELPDSEHIYIVGQATIKAVPDMASVDISIYDTDMDASKAKSMVDDKCAKVIKIAENIGIQKDNITAGHINIIPDFDYYDGQTTYKGTQVEREITLILYDLENYSDLIQKLIEVPITRLNQVTMGSTQIEKLKDQALTEAIENAKIKANKIATQFNAEVGPVYSISETEPQNAMNEMFVTATANKSSRLEPGTIDITANIYVAFRLNVRH